VRAGKLSKRITIQSKATGKGASGGVVGSWSIVTWPGVPDGRIWAGVTPLSGNERRSTSHGGEVAEARTEFVIRYRDGITEAMRVSYNGKFYNIRHVKNFNEKNRDLILTCDTGVNDG
jgi:SPP1 family predicted phage head-tail adaptor